MAATLISLKQAEERVKTRLTKALNSALIVYFALLLVLLLGVFLAQR